MKFKEVPLLPSNWMMDVVECSRKHADKLAIWMHQRYGLPMHLLEPDDINACHNIESGTNSPLKGHKRILVVVEDLKRDDIMVHELIHALWYYAKNTGSEMSFDTQEWQAIMYEYMYKQVNDPKEWEKIPLKSIQL